MPNLIEELRSYVNNNNPPPWYKILHNAHINDNSENCNNLNTFLSATMDEVRLRNMNVYSKKILGATDIDDFSFFSLGVLKREISGDISYSKQRDHSAHALYNYILGWYIFEHNDIIRNSFEKHCKLRNIDTIENYHYYTFFELWPFVSLLHDIGYLFEGSLSSLDITMTSDKIIKGAEFVNNYFKHHFWVENDLHAINERQQIMRMANINEPELNPSSLGKLADSLRFLDDLEILTKQINIEMNNPDELFEICLKGDSFAIWKLHYIFFRNDPMANRIDLLQESFERLLNDGMGPTGVRLVDHGVCSGLLLLLSSTFYFRIYFALKNYISTTDYENDMRIKFITKEEVDYDALHWWRGIVWATAAAAFHNIQQNNIKELASLDKLNIDDDPLTYLGILVDILQIWDRTSIRREKALSGDLPIQGIDINLSVNANKIELDYKEPYISKQIRDDLNLALNGWNDIVDIKP